MLNDRVFSMGVIGAFALTMATGCSTAEAPVATSVSVVNGANPIQDVSYDSLFSQSFDASCNLTTETSEQPPAIAGTAGSTVSLQVATDSCGERPSAPLVTCSWQVTPATQACAGGALTSAYSGTVEFAGASGEVPISLPELTGIYGLGLRCEVDDVPVAIPDARLYVTYGDPLPIAMPPAANWYELAGEWGCGFAADAEESVVLEQMLGSLYDHGREHWRYGSFAAPQQSAYEPYSEGGGWLSCPWQALVDEGDACNFADCFEFSQVFEHISSTFGIGVFAPIYDVGEDGRGFTTTPDAPSLDPRFPGNIDCDENGECDGYLFSSHSLRYRDGLFYDATFDRIYDSAQQFIRSNIEHSSSTFVTLVATSVQLLNRGVMYGDWDRYETTEGPLLNLVPAETASSASPTVRDAAVTRTEGGLVLSAVVDLEATGSFVARALIIPTSEYALPAAQRAWIPATGSGSPAIHSSMIEGPGSLPVSFGFGYPTIEQAGGAGDYTYRIEVFALGDGSVAGTLDAPAAVPVGFAEGSIDVSEQELGDASHAAEITAVSIADVRLASASTVGQMTARVSLTIPQAGDYTLQARLSRNGETYSYAGDRYEIEKGAENVDLVIPLPPELPEQTEADALELTLQLIRNRTHFWYEDSLAFQRVLLQVTGGTIRVAD